MNYSNRHDLHSICFVWTNVCFLRVAACCTTHAPVECDKFIVRKFRATSTTKSNASHSWRINCDANDQSNSWSPKFSIYYFFFCSLFFRRFFKYRQDCSDDINDIFLNNIFRDKYKTPLKHVALRHCSLTDHGMEILLNHDLVSLSLWYCDNVTQKSWQTLIEHGHNLEYLELGRYVDILKHPEPNEKTPIEFTLDLPHIRKLILTGVVLQPAVNFNHLHQLNSLDLTQCTFHNDFTLDSIVNLPNLTTLILFNVWPLEQELQSICQLKSLRKLDISTGYPNTNNYGTFKNPNEVRTQYRSRNDKQ